MAHLMLAGLLSPLTRQLSHLGRYVASYASPAAVATRCISTIPGMRSRSFPAFEPPRTIRCPLLGQCQQLQCVQPVMGMKTKSCLKKRCKDCFFVRRRGRLFVFCKTHPRHKQRQG